MATELTAKRCVPCEGGIPTLDSHQIDELLSQVPMWKVTTDGKSLERRLKLDDFMAAITLFQAVAVVAEAENHHPDLHLTSYNRVRIGLSTHAVGGLTENDFILAAKIDQIPLPGLA